jgi:hypothetical protein
MLAGVAVVVGTFKGNVPEHRADFAGPPPGVPGGAAARAGEVCADVVAVVVVELFLKGTRRQPVNAVAERHLRRLEVELVGDPAADQRGDFGLDRRRELVAEPPFSAAGGAVWGSAMA